MITHKSFILKILFLISSLYPLLAQSQNDRIKSLRTVDNGVYKNAIFQETIRTLHVYNKTAESSFPSITLHSPEQIIISFDDLRADIRNLYYSIQHCNGDWRPSTLKEMDYVQGTNEVRIEDVQLSQNTQIAYTHYKLSFPNEYIKPKISGNYIIQVFEDADKSKLLFTRKIYVIKPLAIIDINIIPSLHIQRQHSHQKLNIEVRSSIEIQNPLTAFQLQAFQNQRDDTKQTVEHPSKIYPQTLRFDSPTTLEFKGHNEFRSLDLRFSRNSSASIKKIENKDSIIAKLFNDTNNNFKKYTYLPDDNGRYFIRSHDYDQVEIQGEYMYVKFSLKSEKKMNENVHLIGGFNNFGIDNSNKLEYDESQQLWSLTQLLKQGIYNYEYILVNGDKIDTAAFSGSHYETENEYTVLAYYRKPGTQWDEIIGIGHQYINNNKTQSGRE